jgi:hypothetical protein
VRVDHLVEPGRYVDVDSRTHDAVRVLERDQLATIACSEVGEDSVAQLVLDAARDRADGDVEGVRPAPKLRRAPSRRVGPLDEADAQPRLREEPGGRKAAEPRADDDGVVVANP